MEDVLAFERICFFVIELVCWVRRAAAVATLGEAWFRLSC